MTDYPVSEGDAQYRIQITGNLGDELLFNVEGVTPNNNSNAKLVGETPKILLLSSVTNEYAYLKININGNNITYSLWVGGYHDMYFANNFRVFVKVFSIRLDVFNPNLDTLLL